LKKSSEIFAFDCGFAGKKEISWQLRVMPDENGPRQIRHLFVFIRGSSSWVRGFDLA